MPGLFGRGGKGLFGPDAQYKLAAAQAALAGDYGGMASIHSQMGRARSEREKDEAERAQLEQLHAVIDADTGLSPQDKAYAKANPKAYIENYMERFSPMNVGPGGGSRGLPGAGGAINNWIQAPRVDEDGSSYAAQTGDGTTPQKMLREGFKFVPVAPGGRVAVHGATTGREITRGEVMGGAPAPGAGQPQPDADDIRAASTDPEARREFIEYFGKAPEAFGGAGRSGPQRFR